MSRRSEGEWWKLVRLAWDKPAGAVAAFIIGALFYWPLPATFEAQMRSQAQSTDSPLAAMASTGYAEATVHLLPLIQMLAAILMAISVAAGVKHIYRHFYPPAVSPATRSRSGRSRASTRRRYRQR